MSSQKQIENDLFEIIGQLEDSAEARAFFQDLCTPAEIHAMAERLKIAKLLAREKLSYREISEKTGASTTTIGRVARFLREENNRGYELVLNRCRKKESENK